MHVDFVITNPSHHVKIVDAVARELLARGDSCRVLSLCEVRGFTTPPSPLDSGAPVVRMIPAVRRSAPTASSDGDGGSRRWLKTAVWRVLIAPGLRRSFRRQRPDVIAVCNEHAFPGDRVLDWYRRKGVPRVLVPEGIRFVASGTAASLGRVDAVAAWGPSSVEYFTHEGFPPDSVRATGSPRHDLIHADLQAMRAAVRVQEHTIAIVTNPVDGGGLGTCTTAEKLAVVARFVREALAANHMTRVVVRNHPGEDADTYRDALSESLAAGRVELNPPGDLFALLAQVPVVVVLGSTVGIEALLAGASLFVLPIPGHGYLHDFVQRGGAVGLSDPMSRAEAEALFASPIGAEERSSYLDTQLSNRGRAATAVAALLAEVAAPGTL